MISSITHLWLLSILGKSGVWVRNFSIRASVLDYLRFGNTENSAPPEGQQWYKTIQNQLGKGPSVLQFKTHLQTASLSNGATFTSALTVGSKIVAVCSFVNGGAGTVTAYTCSDGSNVYTKQINNTDQSNGQGIVIFSAPVTVGGALTVTVAISAGTISGASTSSVLGIYETNGLASATAAASATHQGGGASFATSVSGALVFSGNSVNVSVGGTESFTGTLDLKASEQIGIGRGSGTWNNSGTITFNQMTEASFN